MRGRARLYKRGIAARKQKLTTGLESHSICDLRDAQFDQWFEEKEADRAFVYWVHLMGLGLKEALSASATSPRPIAEKLAQFAKNPTMRTLTTCLGAEKRKKTHVEVVRNKESFAVLANGRLDLDDADDADNADDADDTDNA